MSSSSARSPLSPRCRPTQCSSPLARWKRSLELEQQVSVHVENLDDREMPLPWRNGDLRPARFVEEPDRHANAAVIGWLIRQETLRLRGIHNWSSWRRHLTRGWPRRSHRRHRRQLKRAAIRLGEIDRRPIAEGPRAVKRLLPTGTAVFVSTGSRTPLKSRASVSPLPTGGGGP